MFARPVDPFPSYSPAFASPDVRLKNMSTQSNRLHPQQPPFGGTCNGGFQYLHKDQRRQTDQDSGQDPLPQMDSSLRRKRSFHFEPEFVAALDASLHEPSRSRPSKKLRRTAGGFHLPPLPPQAPANAAATTVSDNESRPSIDLERKYFPSRTTSEGPSIIDLSSGEELAALHLGDNEHKRRRESTVDSNSSSESLREVYDVLEDGTVHPVMDHAPVKPSPMKRMRTEKYASDKLVSLDDLEAGQRPFRKTPKRANRGQENISRMDMSPDDRPSTTRSPTPIAERGALIRYEGPKSMTLADGVEGLLKHRWNESPTLLNAQGNELVLYRRPPPSVLALQDDDDLNGSTIRIEELDDDDTYAPQSMQDSPIRDLEEGIMDMDLD